MTIIITDLEMEIEALREDHILKKKEHEAVRQAFSLSPYQNPDHFIFCIETNFDSSCLF